VQNISHLDKITRELQEMSTSLRMVPLQSTFQKMARLVRDLSKKIGKDVEFLIKGEKTELDKTVVDRIGDPLVHMVRNAIDHGIESSPEKRRENGKPEKGKVSLRAFHKGGSIYIEIEDDGKGLDKNAIFAKAVERGIINETANLSEKEIFSLIFAPGFSTAESVTEVSGRGVGMDVVKKNIEALRGQIDIQSEPGKGSIFSIKLPLTLAIIDGMVVKVGPERYIIPTLSIVMSVSVPKGRIETIQNKGEMLSLQNELIPVFRLERIFEVEEQKKNDTEERLVVIIEEDGMKTGIIIDELLGQQQIVIKNLGEFLKESPGISGGAIMPDGSVGLILDVSGLVKLANA
jgi:two-component system chemotaxis sensor kinase CheA